MLGTPALKISRPMSSIVRPTSFLSADLVTLPFSSKMRRLSMSGTMPMRSKIPWTSWAQEPLMSCWMLLTMAWVSTAAWSLVVSTNWLLWASMM